MSAPTPEVDALLDAAPQWGGALRRLRSLCLDTPMVETVKWNQPCYTFGGKNVVLLSAFSEHACLAFFKGVLLTDEAGLLTPPGENSQAMRQLRVTSVGEIDELEPTIRATLAEAVQLERDGRTVRFKTTAEYAMPEELEAALDADADLRAAWDALTPGRQRGYIVYVGGAKQAATRTRRVETHRARILEGQGLHDR